MCGIAGIYRFQGSPLNEATQSILEKMGHRLRFRGPDDQKLYLDNKTLGFVFRRLSIVDLEGGAQPFRSADGSVTIMVNGEIYNHKLLRQQEVPDYPFQSDSDCEVVLALYCKYGLDFLHKLNGMFAISIYDKNKNQLILIRDRLGVKPLFYAKTSTQHFIFGSEIKAIAAHPECPRSFDWLASMTRVQDRFDIYKPMPASIFKDIHQLDPGTLLIVDEKGMKEHHWWQAPEPVLDNENRRTVGDAIEEYHAILDDSVRLRLMSDVEVGITLSGGIDSVSIAALASKYQNLKTFTVMCNSTFLNGDVKAAHEAAKHLKLENYQLNFPWKNNEIDYSVTKRIIYDMEMDIDIEHVYKYLLCRKIKQDFPSIKTLLMGQGSDEFNGGYSKLYANSKAEFGNDDRNWNQFMEAIKELKMRNLCNHIDPKLQGVHSVLRDDFLEDILDKKAITPWAYYQAMYLRSVMDYNLWHEDRSSSANKLENRVPFLDYRLVEFLMKIPPQLQADLFWDKQILRQSMTRYLPEHLIKRKKVPFFQGAGQQYSYRLVYELLTANNNEFLNEALFDNPHVSHIFDKESISTLLGKIKECPSYSGATKLMQYASWGLLSLWISQGMPEPSVAFKDTLSWYNIKDWNQQEDKLTKDLLESPLKKEDVVFFTQNTTIAFNNDEKSNLSIFRNGSFNFLVEFNDNPSFVTFLKALDGIKSIGEIANEHNFNPNYILSEIAEAIEYGVLLHKKKPVIKTGFKE